MIRLLKRAIGRSRFIRELHAGPVVEFAIIVPVILILLLGVIELAWAFSRRSLLVTATREAARFGATLTDPCASNAALRAELNRRLPVAPRDSVPWANIQVKAPGAVTAGCTQVSDTVVVRITSYPYRPIFPLATPIVRAIDLRASAVFFWERR